MHVQGAEIASLGVQLSDTESQLESQCRAAQLAESALRAQLVDAQRALSEACQAAHDREASLGMQLRDARAELASEKEQAGQRAEERAQWARNTEASTAALNERIALLEGESAKAKAAIADALVVKRDADAQASKACNKH